MSDDLRNALKKLLSEPPNILNKEIWIWGAGDTAKNLFSRHINK